MWVSLDWLAGVSCVAFALTFNVIPSFADSFVKAGIFGRDLCKRGEAGQRKVPEATGVVSGCVFLMATTIMIIPTFLRGDVEDFPHVRFGQLLSALLSIACMLLMGFADDVLDLKWRHKLLLPTLASLPMLVVYYVTSNRTDIVVPLILRPLLGTNIDLGVLYYIYMGMLAIFCTNAINILAGINGLEVGQSIVIALSIVTFNLGELNGPLGDQHRFSLYFLLPFLATSLPLLWYNWYPSRVFVGDTFCYFSGMTLAVVAILGHFSKTLLLFFIPQIGNFVYSVPQLFHFVPCPRHRLPRYNADTDKIGMSMSVFKKKDLKFIGRTILAAFSAFRLIHYREFEEKGETYVECNNLTLINFCLKMFGPMHERTLTLLLMCIQVLGSLVGFAIRYPLALLFYGEIIA